MSSYFCCWTKIFSVIKNLLYFFAFWENWFYLTFDLRIVTKININYCLKSGRNHKLLLIYLYFLLEFCLGAKKHPFLPLISAIVRTSNGLTDWLEMHWLINKFFDLLDHSSDFRILWRVSGIYCNWDPDRILYHSLRILQYDSARILGSSTHLNKWLNY